MHTEDEARGSWCPAARAGRDNVAVNRFPDGGWPDGAFCIASHCMAWRWGDSRLGGDGKPVHTAGYCGLAGRPTL